MIGRSQIIAEARSWIDTPYRHQASLKGAGCDCVGLLRGIWRVFYGPEPERLEPYTPNWAEENARETLYEGIRAHLREIDATALRHGKKLRDADVLLIRVKERGPAKHAVITVAPGSIIHAYERHAVAETMLPDAWRRRIAFAFEFPNLTE